MRLLTALRTKTALRITIPTIAVALIAIFILIASKQWGLGLLTFLIVGLFILIFGMLIDNRRTLNKINQSLREHINQSLREHEGQGSILAAVNDTVSRVDRRTKKADITINNIAGTVGRTAPLVRDIHKQTRNIVVANTRETAAITPTKPGSTTPGKQEYRFPPIKPISTEPTFKKIRVGIVADDFTAEAFGYEWHTFQPTPENWRQKIDEEEPHFIFVESAWEGNGGAWRYHLVGSSAPRPAIREMIEYCRQKGITTVFWNKEDPPHFEDFLPTARLFDHVFTTEGSLIPEYKRLLGHENVHVLAFAAQPKIHNPIRINGIQRTRNVAFGGTYFHHKYSERKRQLDMLLPAAQEYGLDIYSRQIGGDSKYQFPEPYSQQVRGSLPYPEMVTAYHAYKTVLNVNSVTDSETMCARRIFEATACGAAVVTEPTTATQRYFPNGLLSEVRTTEEAGRAIRTLINSSEYRERKVHVAQRHVWETSTYTHRAVEVMGALGFKEKVPAKTASIIITSNRPGNTEIAFQNFARQQGVAKELVYLTHGFKIPGEELSRLKEQYEIEQLTLLEASASDALGKNLNRLTSAAAGDLLVRMDDDDFYGENYTRDMLHAHSYSGAPLVGKWETYVYFEQKNVSVLTYPGQGNAFRSFVRGATFVGTKELFSKYRFAEVGRSEDSTFLKDLKRDGIRIYAADRFNFMVIRRSDKYSHTWQVADDELFATGIQAFIGSDWKQVSI